MKKILLSLGCLAITTIVSAQNPGFEWAKQIGGNTMEQGLSIAIDGTDNIYSLGIFSGTVDFDPGVGVFNLTASTSGDFSVTKLDASGNFMWAKNVGGTNNPVGRDIKVDVGGNVYVSGYFQGTADFDPSANTYSLTSAGSYDAFVLKLDANGNFLWAKNVGGTSDDRSYTFDLDAFGNIYCTGNFALTSDFDPSATATYTLSALATDGFILKLDANGNFVWVKQITGQVASNCYIKGADIDGLGNIIVSGYSSGTTDFDPSIGTYTLSSVSNSWDVYVLKLDMNGDFL